MDVQEWLQYYSGMVARGNMRPEKRAEMVKNCGGKIERTVLKDGQPVRRLETDDEAVERITGEIRELSSKASLEKKADQIIAELRRR